MKIGIVMPLWGREALTRLTLQRCARATAGDSECVLVAVTDERRNGMAARAHGFEIVPAPNVPLSNKKNMGVKHLQGRVDAVVFLGSDDWVVSTVRGQSFLDGYRRLLKRHPCFGPLDMWYCDLQTGRAGYSPGYVGHRRGEPIGAGRAIRADVLDRLNWLPRPPGLSGGHDAAMRKKLRRCGFRLRGFLLSRMGIRIIDIKSGHSMTPYRKLPLRPVSWATALSPFPSKEVALLAAMRTVASPVRSKKRGMRLERKNPHGGRSFGAQKVGQFAIRSGVRFQR